MAEGNLEADAAGGADRAEATLREIGATPRVSTFSVRNALAGWRLAGGPRCLAPPKPAAAIVSLLTVNDLPMRHPAQRDIAR